MTQLFCELFPLDYSVIFTQSAMNGDVGSFWKLLHLINIQ